MKALVKLDLNKMSAREKTALATNVGDAILNNGPTFPACPVDGLDLMDYADSVRDAITAAQAAKATYHTLIQRQQDMLKTLDGFLTRVGSYVSNVAAGNAEIIELARLAVRNPPARVGELDAPLGLSAAPNGNPGTVELRWRAIRAAKAYRVQFATDMSFPEATAGTQLASRAKISVGNLASATRYWFRVAAIGAAGPSHWTNPVAVVTQ